MTTTEVALACGVSRGTVCKWVDSSLLRGYLVPGTRHRRVAPRDLRAFMVANGMGTLAAAVGKEKTKMENA